MNKMKAEMRNADQGFDFFEFCSIFTDISWETTAAPT